MGVSLRAGRPLSARSVCVYVFTPIPRVLRNLLATSGMGVM